MFKKALFFAFCFTLISPISSVFAEEAATEEAANNYQYYPLEPDIITNYVKPGKRIGYVRVSIELMTKSSGDYVKVEENAPLIRDKIITVLGEQTEETIKSFDQREVIRTRCLNEVNEVLYSVIGAKPVQDLHFTKYLYQ